MPAIIIALLGRTGNGKSATGNTILNKIYFKESSNMTSCSKLVKDGENKIDEFTVTVYDTPGLYDTEEPVELMKKKAVEHCDTLMYACTNSGVNVFALVLNYSNSFSPEEISTVEMYEKIFGPAFLKTHGVLVFTHGDNYDVQENGDFKAWCENQTGEMKKFMSKFDGKFFLISNKGPLEGTRGKTGKDLLKFCVEKVKIGEPYKVVRYKQNESNRKSLLGGSSCIIS